MTDTKTSLPAPTPVYDLFVFGDSLSDIGNLFSKLNFPQPPYDRGRFSNGPLAPEILADELGLGISLSTNFAIGGAFSGQQNVNDAQLGGKFGGVLDQIVQFKNKAVTLAADAQDLYLVWAGANDLLNISPTATLDQAQAIVSTAVTNVVSAVTTLAQSGAKNVVVVQAGNLGRVPIVLEQGTTASTTLTSLTLAFNSGLETAMTTLESSVPGLNIILSNLFPVSESVAQTPVQFGFTNVSSSYLPKTGTPVGDPDQFFFWDQVHPTTRGHALFADAFKTSVITGITESVSRVGTAAANILVGFSGPDVLKGGPGDDVLDGNPGDDRINTGSGNDQATGGTGNDAILGKRGEDTLTGVDPTGLTPGLGEIDNFKGGTNADVFVLGEVDQVFYDNGKRNPGLKDYALIADLTEEDSIQLSGRRRDYTLQETAGALPRGTGIYLKVESGKPELIGIVQNVTDLALIGSTLTFV